MRIGETFGNELAAASCDQGVVWTPDGDVLIDPSRGSEYHDEVMAVLAAHNPDKELPLVVTRKQARLSLFKAGLLKQVEDKLQDENRIWYDDSTEWREDDPHVQALAGLLQLTTQQVHALFVQAQTL